MIGLTAITMLDTIKQQTRVLRERFSIVDNLARDNRTHLAATMAWLCRAQDVTKRGNVRDDGVSQTFLVRTQLWAPSYPETTGYIIPTFYDYWRLTGNAEFRERAIRMADWECAVQHESGGVLAGALGDCDVPTVFNTGQVLFGWATAFEEEKAPQYRDALIRAADWLCAVQDEDGCWRRFGSPLTATKINLYNTRTAWGLLRAHEVTGIERYRASAIRNFDWALAQQRTNGWLPHNCLTNEAQPLTHTIAYAMRGFLEAAAYLGDQRYLHAATKIADAMLGAQRPDGALPGRFDAQWQPVVKWICLTGMAQIALNWGRLFQLIGDDRYRQALRRANGFLKSTQKLSGAPDEIGGIKGSHPIDGGYHPWQYPNWAAKFFADSLMIDEATSMHPPRS
jgi:rhamnogalacturonyl hydrolase YesR